MTTAIIELIFILLVAGSLIFLDTSFKISVLIMGVVLFLLTVFAWNPVVILFWLLFLSTAIFFMTPYLRRHYFVNPIFKMLQKKLPPISDTERQALEAGGIGWEGDLFSGKPDWKKLKAFPKPQLTVEEQAFLDNQVETLCGLLNDWKMVHEDGDLPKAAWDYIKQEGFFGLVIPKEYGGHGFSALAHSTIVMKIATRSASAAITVMVPNSLGPGELIYYYGTAEQKNYYLPRLARGEEIPCFGLTAPEAGSDATAIPDTGIVCRGDFQGKNIIGIRLNWDKRYITLAPVASVIGLAFKLYDPEHLLSEKEDRGITLCLVPRNYPGVEAGSRHLPLHLVFTNGPVRGKDVFIPLDWVIGGASMCGKGWSMLMECLAIGRGISLPALAAASAKFCYRTTGAYAKVRKQFKMSIGKLEGVQEALARIGGFTYLAEATRLMTADAVANDLRPSLGSAITKYHLTELSRKIVNDAMDIHGGKAIQLGPRNYLGLLHDAIPTSITVEGANILTRNLIIFGQGAIRCHPFVREEMQIMQNAKTPDSLSRFDKVLSKHVCYALNSFVKTAVYGLTGGKFIAAPVKGELAVYYRQFQRMSSALAFVSNVTLGLLGGDLKRKERLSARLGDVLSYLYLGSSVLRYYENQNQPVSDLVFVHWTLQWCLAQIQIAFDEFCDNFSYRKIGKLLHGIIFPWGRAYKMPNDFLGQSIAENMLKPSAARDRITQYCYEGKEGDAAYCIEKAFQTMIAAETVQLKLKNAKQKGAIPVQASLNEQLEAAIKAGIISSQEKALMDEAQRWQKEAIAVDEFNPIKSEVPAEAKEAFW